MTATCRCSGRAASPRRWRWPTRDLHLRLLTSPGTCSSPTCPTRLTRCDPVTGPAADDNSINQTYLGYFYWAAPLLVALVAAAAGAVYLDGRREASLALAAAVAGGAAARGGRRAS